MAGEHSEHAQRVVAAFRDKLSQSGREHVGAKHFEELEMLIELAIATSVNKERELQASKLESFAKSLRASEYSD
ncbi:hypothetical protein [Marinospirillum perlucidum]|uniref:hypothetical protein n=1 Tax=Marinospirillum perlucidum TaxID=1982602 RepID=UPI000DF27011|nr:hypothetical protein [Marinospirillum perlucidum]